MLKRLQIAKSLKMTAHFGRTQREHAIAVDLETSAIALKKQHPIADSDMKKWYCLLLYVNLFSIGCSRNTMGVETIDIENNFQSEISVNDLFGDISYITTDTTSNGPLIGPISKAAIYDDIIYIADGRAIHTFNMNGSFITSICRYGRAEAEYMGISDFTVHQGYLYIIDHNKKFLKYTLQGDYVASTHVDFYPATLTAIDDEHILLTSAYQAVEDKFHIYDNIRLKRLHSFFSNNENQTTWRHFRGQSNFYRYDNRLLFHEPMNNEVYQIKDTMVTPFHYLDMFGRNAPMSFWKQKFKNVMDFNMKFNKHGYCAGIPDYYENDKIIWYTYRDGGNYRLCKYSKKTHIAKQSDKLFFPEISLTIPIESVTFAPMNEKKSMIVITGDFIDPHIKTSVLNVPENYDNVIFVLKK